MTNSTSLKSWLLALTLSLGLAGCPAANDDDSAGDDDDAVGDDDDAMSCPMNDAVGPSNSHGHSVTIPAADIQNPPAGGRTYNSVGGHPHTVTLSQQDLMDLAANCTITTTNSSGHFHSWVITIS